MMTLEAQPVRSLHFPQRLCAVCGGGRSELLYAQRFAGTAELALLEGYDLVVCQDCGFCFADHIPDQAAFDAYYRACSKYEYQHQGGRESEYDMARFRIIADSLQEFLPSVQARILDVGCSTGGLLAILKERGFVNVLGLDPSPVCAETARRLYGIRVLPHTLADVGATEGKFDFVILIGVLEHVRGLSALLEQVGTLLAPSGQVYVEVPDATSFLQSRNAPFQEFSVEHINYLSPTSLENVMSQSGFVPVATAQTVREHRFATMAPVIGAVFQKSTHGPRSWKRDHETLSALGDYIRQSHALEESALLKIQDLAASREPLLVWGAGTHTLRLLAASDLSRANIAAFVDSNPKFQGKTLHGVPILAPAALKARPEAILISSWMCQHEIQQQIRDVLQLSNPVILLYDI